MLTSWLGKWFGGWFGASAPAPVGSMSGVAQAQFGATGSASAVGALSGTAALLVATSGTISAPGAVTDQATQRITRAEVLYATATVPTLWFQYSQLAIRAGHSTSTLFVGSLERVLHTGFKQQTIYYRAIPIRQGKIEAGPRYAVRKRDADKTAFFGVRSEPMVVGVRSTSMVATVRTTQSLVVAQQDKSLYARGRKQ